MGFLSQVAPDKDVSIKPEDGNKTFYGTAIAAHDRDVRAYEMGEDKVSYQFSSGKIGRLNTNANADPGTQCLSIRMSVSSNFRMSVSVIHMSRCSAHGRNTCIELGFVRHNRHVSLPCKNTLHCS
jgi:hypothetical protein